KVAYARMLLIHGSLLYYGSTPSLAHVKIYISKHENIILFLGIRGNNRSKHVFSRNDWTTMSLDNKHPIINLPKYIKKITVTTNDDRRHTTRTITRITIHKTKKKTVSETR